MLRCQLLCNVQVNDFSFPGPVIDLKGFAVLSRNTQLQNEVKMEKMEENELFIDLGQVFV